VFRRLRSRGLLPALFIPLMLVAAFVVPRLGSHQGFVIDAQAYVCTGAGLTAAPPTTMAGTAVVFTATSTCPSASPKYEFWLRTASTDWQMIQGFSTNNVYNWNSTGAPTGIVYFGVWVKDATSSTSGFDANYSLAYSITGPCGTATLTPASGSVTQGTHDILTAAATCAHASPLFEFWLRTATTDWIMIRAFNTTATYDWNSAGAPAGLVYFGVWVKDAQSGTATFDSNASTTVTVTAVACSAVTITALPTTVVHGVGTHVTITAAATCPNASPKYEFWLRTTGTDWFSITSYSTTATYDWNSTGAPVTTVYIGVWAKDANSITTTNDVANSVAIPVT
jgi:hypothetical protein